MKIKSLLNQKTGLRGEKVLCCVSGLGTSNSSVSSEGVTTLATLL